MVDLFKDKNLGKILTSFHESGRPTGIICHGPIVLLSALPDPDAFIASMIAGDGKASSMTKGWPYAGYRVTIFSTGEEQALEGPNGLVGNVQFYPVNALAEAGARVESIANWHSNVVVDRELITGQQSMSAPEFGLGIQPPRDAGAVSFRNKSEGPPTEAAFCYPKMMK